MLKRNTVGFIFLVFFALTSIAQTTSEKGAIDFSNKEYFLMISLVNNHKEVISNWDTNPEKYTPEVSPKKTFKIGDTVVPFIVFSSTKRDSVNLKCNFYLVKPDGKISSNKGDEINIANGKVKKTLLYRSASVFGWTFDDTDPLGKYEIHIEIYDNERFREKFVLTFELEK